MGNRCSRSRLFAFYFWRPPFENSALWHGTTGARGACIKGPWQREVPTHARSVNWLRCFSVAPFGCQAPENLGSRKSFRSSNACCPLTGLKGAIVKNEDVKNHIQRVRLHLLPRLHQFQIKGLGERDSGLLQVAKGCYVCFLLQQGGAPHSFQTPKSWITPKSEKADFTGGSASLQLGANISKGKY